MEGPEFPEALAPLLDIAYQLHGRSGVGFGDVAPLSYATVAEYQRLHGLRFTVDEVGALMALDSAMFARAEEPRPAADAASPAPPPAWPKPKVQPNA